MKDKAISEIAKLLFDTEKDAQTGAEILQAVVRARSARWTEIAREMKGTEAGAYKRLQRFMEKVDLMEKVRWLHDSEAPFVIGDPTEIARPEAKKTPYVGYLKDGKTRGFWMLMLATPYRGRALPCGFVTYSSATISSKVSSRNQYHFAAFEQVKALLGERPLVLDREFSYLGLLTAATVEGINFVIRLKMSGPHPPRFTDVDGQEVKLRVTPGKTEIYNQVLYKGKVLVNVIAHWRKSFRQPLWVMTTLPPQDGLDIYLQRMKIELSFRDLKSLLGLDRLMNKKERWMQQSMALLMLAFAIVLVFGECLRDLLFGHGLPKDISSASSSPSASSRKWRLYSGPFIFLKYKCPLSSSQFRSVFRVSRSLFLSILFPDVRTPVPT